jgi:hypothetical protein
MNISLNYTSYLKEYPMQRNSLFSTNSAPSVELDEADRKTLKTIELMIDSNRSEYIDKLIYGLPRYPIDLLQRLYDASPKLKDFCQKNAKFQEAIADSLHRHGFMNVEINSMDGKEYFSLFDIFIAAGNLGKYYNYINLPQKEKTKEARLHGIQSLNKACELGLYQALTARCDQNTTLLLSQAASSERKEEAIASILNDTKRLSNLYWKLGYIQAASILQEMAEKTVPLWDEKGREGINRLALFLEECIKNYLCAFFLEDHPYSNKIELGLTLGKGYVDYIMDKRGIKVPTWEEAKIKFRSWVKNNDATYERLLNTAKREIDTILKPNNAETKINVLKL